MDILISKNVCKSYGKRNILRNFSYEFSSGYMYAITGASGAGKSTTLKMMEDMGYFCVDNLPVPLLDKFAQLVRDGGSGLSLIHI